MLTENEHYAIELTSKLGEVMREIIGDGPAASGDWGEFVAHIHPIQNMILAQCAARDYPERYRLMGGKSLLVSQPGKSLDESFFDDYEDIDDLLGWDGL